MPSQFPGEIGYSKITAHKLTSCFNDVTQRLHETNQVNISKHSKKNCRHMQKKQNNKTNTN